MLVSALKRRILVGELQYRLVVGNLLYLSCIVLAFAAALFGPVVMLLRDPSADPAQRAIAAHQMLALNERVWFAVPLIVALCLFHSAVVSHRIAGPLLRFQRIFHNLGQGDLSQKVAIRRDDYLHAEAALIEAMVRNMATKMAAIEGGYAEARASLADLRRDLERPSNRLTEAKCERLAALMDDLGRQISEFRTPQGVPERPEEEDRATPELIESA